MKFYFTGNPPARSCLSNTIICIIPSPEYWFSHLNLNFSHLNRIYLIVNGFLIHSHLMDLEIMAEKAVYKPRDTRNSLYYQCVEDCFETFEQVYEERFERRYGFYRPYVMQVIYRYLDYGILQNGFARVKCDECGHEYLLAHSCKRRHFCPSNLTYYKIWFRTSPTGM